MFPELNGSNSTQFNPYVISSIGFPDGTSYSMLYNSYGELTKLTLPTGAVIGYKYSEVYSGGWSGVVALSDNVNYNIVRSLLERDEYADGSTLSAKMFYYCLGGTDSVTGRPNQNVTTDFEDANGNLLSQRNHRFYGNPVSTAPPPADNAYADWWEGLEYFTNVSDGNNVQQQTLRLYQQRPWSANEANPWFPVSGATSDAQPLHDPQMCEVTNTLGSTGAAGTVFVYDQYNNVTDQFDFDYGAAPGASMSPAISTSCPTPPFGSAIRETQTSYVISGGYTTPGNNLISLPSEVIVLDGSGTKYSDTKFGYDGANPQNAPNIIGHDNVNYPAGRRVAM